MGDHHRRDLFVPIFGNHLLSEPGGFGRMPHRILRHPFWQTRSINHTLKC